MTSHFFDDYPIVDVDGCADDCDVTDLFRLIGIPPKAPGRFEASFNPLGVNCDLGESGVVTLKNTEKRLDEMRAKAGSLSSLNAGDARALRGRFQFARSRLFSRVGIAAVVAIGRVTDGTSLETELRGGRRASDLQNTCGSRQNGWASQTMLFIDEFVKERCLEPSFLSQRSVRSISFEARFPFSELPLAIQSSNGGVRHKTLTLWNKRECSRSSSLNASGKICCVTCLSSLSSTMTPPNTVWCGNVPPRLASVTLMAASARINAEFGMVQWLARVLTCADPAGGPSGLDFSEAISNFGAIVVPMLDGRLHSWNVVADLLRAPSSFSGVPGSAKSILAPWEKSQRVRGARRSCRHARCIPRRNGWTFDKEEKAKHAPHQVGDSAKHCVSF